ncbi:hypothetical protein F170042I7_21200 [Blautia caecimuris]
MTIGMLKQMIKDSGLPEDAPVFVCCEGYTNYDKETKSMCKDDDTFAIVHDGKCSLLMNVQ